MDSVGNPLAVTGEIVNKKKQSLDNLHTSVDMIFKFKSDTAMSIKVNSELFYNFHFIDSLKLNCLIVNSKDKIFYTYTDGRKDTVVSSNSDRLYGKGKGLLQFAYGNSKTIYRLNTQHPK